MRGRKRKKRVSEFSLSSLSFSLSRKENLETFQKKTPSQVALSLAMTFLLEGAGALRLAEVMTEEAAEG